MNNETIVESLKKLSDGLSNNQLNAVQAVNALAEFIKKVETLENDIKSLHGYNNELIEASINLSNTNRDLTNYKITYDNVLKTQTKNEFDKLVFEAEKKFYTEHIQMLKQTINGLLQYKTFIQSGQSNFYNGGGGSGTASHIAQEVIQGTGALT